MGLETEHEVIALVARQRRIGRTVIQIQNRIIGIAAIMLGHRVGQRQRDARTGGLGDDADPPIQRFLEGDNGFLCAQLVVESHDFKHVTVQNAAIGVYQIGAELYVFAVDRAHIRKRTRKRIDMRDADRFSHRRAGKQSGCGHCHQSRFQCHAFLPCRWISCYQKQNIRSSL